MHFEPPWKTKYNLRNKAVLSGFHWLITQMDFIYRLVSCNKIYKTALQASKGSPVGETLSGDFCLGSKVEKDLLIWFFPFFFNSRKRNSGGQLCRKKRQRPRFLTKRTGKRSTRTERWPGGSSSQQPANMSHKTKWDMMFVTRSSC